MKEIYIKKKKKTKTTSFLGIYGKSPNFYGDDISANFESCKLKNLCFI